MAILNHRTVKARKPHVCYWCGEKISAGESCETWSETRDRTMTSIRVHPECSEAWSEMASLEGGYYETRPHEFSRGCMCPRGQCECEKKGGA